MDEYRNTISATGKSLDIIDLIKSQDGARLSEVTDALDISKSTAHSHLNTLRSYGYISKEGEIYHLSLKFFHIGQYTRNTNKHYRLAAEKTKELSKTLNHSIDFDVETNGRIITIFHEADESAEVGLKEGDCLYVHTSSTGKAILAEFTDHRINEIIDRWGLPERTTASITNRDELMEDIRETRERGYAVIDQEWLEGLRAVGVAVKLPNGEPLGALSAGGPTYRLTTDVIENEVSPELIEAAEELENKISTVISAV